MQLSVDCTMNMIVLNCAKFIRASLARCSNIQGMAKGYMEIGRADALRLI